MELAPPRQPQAVHDPEWIRLMRRRDILEHRMSELQGLMEGRRLSRRKDRGLQAIAEWIQTEETLWETWPASRIREVLGPCLDSDWSNANERDYRVIENALQGFEGPLRDAAAEWAQAPDAPFDQARITFEGKRMVFTGVFRACERFTAEEATSQLGGLIRSSVAKVTDFLIVGARCQPGWKHKRRGRKIEQVAKWRDERVTQCMIVSEEAWAEAVIETVNLRTQDAKIEASNAQTG